MTTLALPKQDEKIREISQRLFGDEWLVHDTYQTDHPFTFKEAASMLERLYQVQAAAGLSKPQRREMFQALVEGRRWEPPKPDPPVDQLVSDVAIAINRDPEPIVSAHSDPQPEVKPWTDDINHGTRAGNQAHRRRDEKPCEACYQADRAYSRQLRERKKAGVPRANGARSDAQKPKPRAPKGDLAAPTESPDRAVTRSKGDLSGDSLRRRYLHLLLTHAESQPIPDREILDRIEKLLNV